MGRDFSNDSLNAVSEGIINIESVKIYEYIMTSALKHQLLASDFKSSKVCFIF